jgi:hypothetical protein|tara:strand:+ start:2138 stop:3130 length:993 start_codon:yes stop_codon:yes gene_type:complete
MATPHIFYPYPAVRTGWLSLRAELKAESEGVSQLTHGSIEAVGATEPFEIDLTLEFDPGIARRDLNLEEDQSNHVQLVLVESGIHSRLRVKVAEFPLHGGTGAVKTVRYDPADCRGDIALQAFLVYTVRASGVVSGTRCSESERVLVHFDEFGSPPGQGIEIKWVDFSEEDRYTDVKDELFVLDLITEPPVLLLNEGLPGFKSVLMSRGTRGSAARIREAEFTLIESQVWNVMLAEALGRLVDAGDDEEEINEQLGGWRGRVLRGWAPALMGYREAGVKDLASRMRAHPDELLLNILPRKVQLRAGAGHSFSGLNGEFIDQHTTRETDDE